MGIHTRRTNLRSLPILLLSLIALGALSGCVTGRFYWGPSVSGCSGSGSAAKFGSGACRNGAENYVAWKKSQQALPQADSGSGEEELTGQSMQSQQEPAPR